MSIQKSPQLAPVCTNRCEETATGICRCSRWQRIARCFQPRLPPVLVVLNSTSLSQICELDPFFQAIAGASGLQDRSAASGTLLRSQLCYGGAGSQVRENLIPRFWKPEQSQPLQLHFLSGGCMYCCVLLPWTCMRAHRRIVCVLQRGTT